MRNILRLTTLLLEDIVVYVDEINFAEVEQLGEWRFRLRSKLVETQRALEKFVNDDNLWKEGT